MLLQGLFKFFCGFNEDDKKKLKKKKDKRDMIKKINT